MEEIKITKKEVIDQLAAMIKAYENIPPQAQYQPVNQTDFQSLLLIVYAALKAVD